MIKLFNAISDGASCSTCRMKIPTHLSIHLASQVVDYIAVDISIPVYQYLNWLHGDLNEDNIYLVLAENSA